MGVRSRRSFLRVVRTVGRLRAVFTSAAVSSHQHGASAGRQIDRHNHLASQRRTNSRGLAARSRRLREGPKIISQAIAHKIRRHKPDLARRLPQPEPFHHHGRRQRHDSGSARLRKQFEICDRDAAFDSRRIRLQVRSKRVRRIRGNIVALVNRPRIAHRVCLFPRIRIVWTTRVPRSFHERRPTVRIVVLRLRLGGAGRAAGHGGALHTGEQRQTRSSDRHYSNGAKPLMNLPTQR
jgi:hypothetical protein